MRSRPSLGWAALQGLRSGMLILPSVPRALVVWRSFLSTYAHGTMNWLIFLASLARLHKCLQTDVRVWSMIHLCFCTGLGFLKDKDSAAAYAQAYRRSMCGSQS